MTLTQRENSLVRDTNFFSDVNLIVENQRAFFASGKTKSVAFRIEQLTKLRQAFLAYQTELTESLFLDLRKSEMEAFSTEIGVTISEIEHNIKHLRSWSSPKKIKTPLFFMPGKSRIYYEPYGVTLVISPWNFPVKNLFGPVLGAITAGNCCVLKPSEISPHTSGVVKKMIEEFFDPSYIKVVEGGVEETTELLKIKFDYLFFTGGTEIGRIVYGAAAKHLTPVTLELGGKSPTIIDEQINLDVTAKRICWGKFVNAGQACVSPDYFFVHNKVKNQLIEKLKFYIKEFFGDDPSTSTSYGRIISTRHYKRITGLIEGNVVFGGQINEADKYIGPTIIDNVKPDAKVMCEEIFGPIIPIMGYDSIDEVIAFVNKREKPLALYLFSTDTNVQNRVINETSSGGVCINETIMHMASSYLPFGGIGSSGMGAYNGWYGFDTFSHKKPVMTRSFLFDVTQKYPPFTGSKFNFVKFALKWLT